MAIIFISSCKIMRILFFGDIVGKLGRRALAKVLASVRSEYKADVVIANVENLAHGKGITETTVQEMLDIGIDVMTSGNHIFNKPAANDLLINPSIPLIRPANYPAGTPGRGHIVIDVHGKKLGVINLMGRAFFRETLDDPFKEFDNTLGAIKNKHGIIPIIVDWHTEATSEKQALGWYADGRVTAVLGTHTHIPTADTRILPKGTGFVADVGMVGARDGILGVDRDGPLTMMVTQKPQKFEIPKSGITQINGIYLDIDTDECKTRTIERVDREIALDEAV